MKKPKTLPAKRIYELMGVIFCEKECEIKKKKKTIVPTLIQIRKEKKLLQIYRQKFQEKAKKIDD